MKESEEENQVSLFEMDQSNLVDENLYNKSNPFRDYLKEQGPILFDEIRENLFRCVQLEEFGQIFSIWTKKLKDFLVLFRLHFTKNDHLKLIHLYLSILSMNNIPIENIKESFDILYNLLKFAQFFWKFPKEIL